ncbi:MAG: hypothetical protein IPJ16_07965 [Bacteroidales bacterium]|nr:hypothetical protein [Bacteroidales bacterium]
MIQYLRLFFFIGVFGVLSFSCNFRNGGIPANEKPASYNNEQYRPQYHFSPDSAWMNDPNGMFFLDGEYHLFYQYYPDSTVWGPMHWGHAVSKDMIKWQHLPVAIYPDSLGYIFSGSAVADTKNSSGLGTIQNPPVVAIYTYHNPVLEKKAAMYFRIRVLHTVQIRVGPG